MNGEPRIWAWLRLEDYWAIWLGFLFIAFGMIVFIAAPYDSIEHEISQASANQDQIPGGAPFTTIEQHQLNDAKSRIKASSQPLGKSIGQALAPPHSWTGNPFNAFVFSESAAETLRDAASAAVEARRQETQDTLSSAIQAEDRAREAGFENHQLNRQAADAIAHWRAALAAESSAKKKAAVSAYNKIPSLAVLCVVFGLLFALGVRFIDGQALPFLKAFPVVFLLAVLAYLLASQSTMKALGIGYAAWAIVIGLLISNTIGVPEWLKPAIKTEFYIKTGLVILGAEILFGKILAIGAPGIFVAWIVTPIVLVTTYWFGQAVLKMSSKTLNITISADMSVCGVSAAIATAAACKAKKEELTLAVGLSLVFTSIMMVLMPWFINAVGMDHVLGGAWIGGVIDATGAVAAAGAFLSDRALYVAATIKMIQNILIGVIAFCVAVYWSAYVERGEQTRVGAGEIWRRFPKFVLGFIGASILMSGLYQALGDDLGYSLIDQGLIRGYTKFIRGWFFCLAFVSIGLATNFIELKEYFSGGKPLILYLCGQTLNLILTLTMAYIMFYLVFPDITAGL